MALTHFAFVEVGIQANGVQLPASVAAKVNCEGIAPSGSNQQTTEVAPSTGRRSTLCRVATDTAVYVAFGTNPNAATGTTARFFVPANAIEFFVVAPGDKGAVVTI